MKRLILAIIAVFMIVVGSAMLVSGQEIDIEISTESNAISVLETITPEDDLTTMLICFYPLDNELVINDVNVTLSYPYNLPYAVNLTQYEIAKADVYKVKYYLDDGLETYQTRTNTNVTSLTIKFDGKQIFSGTNLKSDSLIKVPLQKQSPGETVTVENIPTLVYAIIAVLVILLIAIFFFSKKIGSASTSPKTVESKTASKEYLSTKKGLLMDLLKEVEKKHRSKKISDETYHKIKDRYKQEAVDTMKKLEDIK